MGAVPIKGIDFGKIDGKSEAEKNNFLELFYDDNSHYHKLKHENCFIISGYKGTGKTILASYFGKKKSIESKAIVRNLNSTHFVQEKLLTFSRSEMNKNELVVFWKYVYLREFGHALIEKKDKSFWFRLTNRTKLKKLESLLNEAQLVVNNAETFTQYKNSKNLILAGNMSLDNFLEFTPKLSGKTSNEILQEHQNSKNSKLVRAKYIDIINNLEKLVFSLLNTKNEFFLIYDDMDQLDEQLDRAEFVDLIKQMLYASESLNQRFRDLGLPNRVIHAIRSDVLRLAVGASYNLFKSASDFGVEIDWFSDRLKNPEKHPLMLMILHKIKNSVREYAGMSDKDIYDTVFVRDDPILDHLLNHSFGRPREIVKYLIIVQDRFPCETQITLEMLKECLPIYSKWFYDSLMSEIRLSENFEVIKKVFNAIQLRGKVTFTESKLSNFSKSKGAPMPDNFIEILTEMYQMGVLGIMTNTGMVQFHYRSNAPIIPNSSTRFVVHYGLLKFLNLR